jgi:hypothetical protein
MVQHLPHIVIDYNDGLLGDGVGWVWLGSKRGDRRVTQSFYQQQFDNQNFEPLEGSKVLMRDADGDLPDAVGVLHWSESRGWVIDYDPEDLKV